MKTKLILFILIISSFMVVHSQSIVPMENILVIHSYHQGLQWTDDISEGIISVLRDENVNIHFEYLDTKRNSSEDYYKQLVYFEHQKNNLSNIDFKLIICSDNNALRFIMEHGETLFPNVPIVFCGINNFTPELIQNRQDITGIVERIDYRTTLDLIKTLHPNRTNMIIIVDRTNTGYAIKAEMEAIIKEYGDSFTFEFYQDFVLDDVPDRISPLGDKDVIYLLAFNRDIEGNFISYNDGIKMIREYSEVPIYGGWDFYFGNGIIGGMLTSGKDQGIAAANYAKQVLNGTPASELEIELGSPNRIKFDFNELKRFGIDIKKLPKESLIINLPQNQFENAYKLVFVITIFSLITFIILLIRNVQQKRHQKQLKVMNLELEKRVKEKTSDLTEKVLLIEKQNKELQTALDQIRTLKGIIPICSKCKNIRNDKGYWNRVEHYISENTDAVFSHSLCPTCIREEYPDLADKILNSKD